MQIGQVEGSNPFGSTKFSPMSRTNPSRWRSFGALSLGTAILLLAPFLLLDSGRVHAAKQPAEEVPSDFYVVHEIVSDVSPFWSRYILDVRAEGSRTRVRYIRIAPLDALCDRVVTVQAVERILPDTTPAQLGNSARLCSVSEGEVQELLKKHAWKSGVIEIWDTGKEAVVADCGDGPRIFAFPFPEAVQYNALKRDDPQVDRIWNLSGKIYDRVFGKRDIFDDTSPEHIEEMYRLGEQLVPEIRSGRFDAGLQSGSCGAVAGQCSRSFADILKEYRKPMAGYDPAAAILRDREELKFEKYVAITYPPLARQARIHGAVEADLTLDPASGRVLDVHSVSGHPILQPAVVGAARQWIFDPAVAPVSPFRVHIDFAFRCPDE